MKSIDGAEDNKASGAPSHQQWRGKLFIQLQSIAGPRCAAIDGIEGMEGIVFFLSLLINEINWFIDCGIVGQQSIEFNWISSFLLFVGL